MPGLVGSELELGVILLAAGRSARMGQPKLLLAWGETTVLGHLVRQWQELGAQQIAVVMAQDDRAVVEELERLKFPQENRITNPQPERGMFSSIQCAARWAGWRTGVSHWAIVLGDQPHLHLSTLRSVLQFARAHPEKVCQPAFQGRARHPVLLPEPIFKQLAATRAGTLKQFLAEFVGEVCEVNDPGLALDMDYPEDYQRALKLGGRAGEG